MLTRSWVSTYVRPFSWLAAIIIFCVWRRFSCQGTTLIFFNLPSENIRNLLVKYRNQPLHFSKLLGDDFCWYYQKRTPSGCPEAERGMVALPAIIWGWFFGAFILVQQWKGDQREFLRDSIIVSQSSEFSCPKHAHSLPFYLLPINNRLRSIIAKATDFPR